MQAVGNGKLFEMQPEALNRIEKRTVLGQPDHQEAIFQKAQSSLCRLAMVVGGIVHNDKEMLARIFSQQMLKESDKGITVFVRRGLVVHPSTVPIITPKTCRNCGLLGAGTNL